MYTHCYAGTPTAPNEVTGSIQNISDVTVTQTGAKAVASLNWSQPENQDEMAIDYYEITLVGSHVNNTLSVCMIDQPQQTVSYKYVLPEGNYTAASITAVDLCGKRSAPSELILKNIDPDTIIDVATQQSQSRAVGAGLGAALGVTLIIVVALIIAVIIIRIRCHKLVLNHAAVSLSNY